MDEKSIRIIIYKSLNFIRAYSFAFISSVYLFLVGFIFSRNRDLIRQLCEHFSGSRVKAIIPKVKIAQIIDVKLPVRIAEIEPQPGNVALSELAILALFAKAFNAVALFEIGTFDGRTTLNLALNSAPEAKVYTIDLPKEKGIDTALVTTTDDKEMILKNLAGARIAKYSQEEFPEKNKIIQISADSATFDFSPYLKKMDLVFIDGAHSYEYLVNDSKMALELLRSDKGVIIWHDYDGTWPGVTKALNEIYLNNRDLNIYHIAGTNLVCLIRPEKEPKGKI